MNPITTESQPLIAQLYDYLDAKKAKEAELAEIECKGRELMTQILHDIGHGPFCVNGQSFRIFGWRRRGKGFPTLRFYKKDLVW